MIDLRSDTVTLPTREMLEAIMEAKLGDMQHGEDETVNQLEELSAKILGKEAALLVTSGTQANLTAMMSHADPGSEVILERESHILYYEVGGMSRLGGLFPRPIRGDRGFLDPKEVEASIRPRKDVNQPKTGLICLENTHNRAGGTVLIPDQIRQITETAKKHDIPVHLDGARIFNASVALGFGKDPRKLVETVNSVSFCLSKGLSAPVGSILTGSAEFIERARKIRQMLGGALRQGGIIAAPGIVALKNMIPRLAEDHKNAQTLGNALSELGIRTNSPIETNIVLFDISSTGYATSNDFIQNLRENGVLASNYGKTTPRMVTHKGIEESDIEKAVKAIKSILPRRTSS